MDLLICCENLFIKENQMKRNNTTNAGKMKEERLSKTGYLLLLNKASVAVECEKNGQEVSKEARSRVNVRRKIRGCG